ncbi:MAG: DUF1501 domain-containing protein [Gemmataceae bacterium]
MHLPSRRHFLSCTAGSVALSWLLAQQSQAMARAKPSEKKPHHPPTAKRVIFLFMVGGPSAIDLFDPKPALAKWQGKPLPPSFGVPVSQFTSGKTPLLASRRKFAQHGESGLPVSDLMPHLAKCVDDICFLRSCWATSTVHAPAMYHMHSGRTQMGYPSLGSWVTYGLGCETENLPAYCVLLQPEGTPEGGAPCWSAGFLPAEHQGTLLRRGPNPILNLRPPEGVSAARQARLGKLLQEMNADDIVADDPLLKARLASYELAFHMQKHAPEAVDLSRESAATRKLYGVDDKVTADFGTRLLLARRLVERGVRFVQVYSGGGPLITQWDAHDDVDANHEAMCARVDRPIAGLLTDLKGRGLLKDTLVIWCSEFGRTPMSQGGKGRDHNPWGFTMWLAGGGVKGGQAIGATDEFGLKAIHDRISVNDFHATILHLLGLDHERLTYPHSGRDERLTDVAGRVVEGVMH